MVSTVVRLLLLSSVAQMVTSLRLVSCKSRYVAQMRKIAVGDKLGGRHGNKGVIARALPQSDMPFNENGGPN